LEHSTRWTEHLRFNLAFQLAVEGEFLHVQLVQPHNLHLPSLKHDRHAARHGNPDEEKALKAAEAGDDDD
jgi:hypothetical protein